MSDLTPFHLAFPVHDLEAAREFYTQALGAGTGRESDRWIDFDLHGHQIVAHHKEGMDDWKAMSERLIARDDTRWIIKPRIRFEGQPGEQATFFLLDPSGNALEFKAFADMNALFAT